MKQSFLSSFTKLVSPRITFCRKSFLVFVLAFAVLTLGRNQEAMGQQIVCDDWGCYEVDNPLFIEGLSTIHYQCTTGSLTNTVTVGQTATANDTFTSAGPVSCDFTNSSPSPETCSYQLTWTGPNLVQCTVQNGNAVVTVSAQCDNANVTGSLVCPSHGTDLLGISSVSECRRLYGTDNILSTQVIFGQTDCASVLSATNTGAFKLEGVTKTTTDVCHSDFGLQVDCIAPGGQTNKSNSDLTNLARTACEASPQTWNIDCSGNKDNGTGTVCFVNGGAGGLSSFDPTTIDGSTATLNGVSTIKKGCIIKDCNGDGVLDFQCTFPTCSNGSVVEPLPQSPGFGELTMIANFKNNSGGGLICSDTVATSGNP